MARVDPLAPLLRALNNPAPPSSDFDLNPEITPPASDTLRAAAVLVPVIADQRGARVILTKRASGMKHHPGQIALPGGKVDAGDVGVEAAALREAHEEIGLDSQNVEVLGSLAPHLTVTQFLVTPILARVHTSFDPVAEPGEVAEVFTAPLDHLLDVDRYVIQSRYWQRQRRYYYTVPYGPYYIWGATARILRALAEQVRV